MENTSEVVVFAIIGSLFALSLALALIAFFTVYRKRFLDKEARIQMMEQEKQIEVYKAAYHAEETEKEKIAKLLHDEVIPTLTVVHRGISRQNKESKTNEADLLLSTMEQIRQISHDLMPAFISAFGFIEALAFHVRQFDGSEGCIADFENNTGLPEKIPMPASDQRVLYRLCLEVLNNIRKHGKPEYLKVTVRYDEPILIIEFAHDGRGIRQEEVEKLSGTSGIGLKSIFSGAIMVNASVLYAVEDEISTVTIHVPLKHE